MPTGARQQLMGCAPAAGAGLARTTVRCCSLLLAAVRPVLLLDMRVTRVPLVLMAVARWWHGGGAGCSLKQRLWGDWAARLTSQLYRWGIQKLPSRVLDMPQRSYALDTLARHGRCFPGARFPDR